MAYFIAQVLQQRLFSHCALPWRKVNCRKIEHLEPSPTAVTLLGFTLLTQIVDVVCIKLAQFHESSSLVPFKCLSPQEFYTHNCSTGLFAPNHIPYDKERNTGPDGQPSLEEMTRQAISVLQKNPKGFLLIVCYFIISLFHAE